MCSAFQVAAVTTPVALMWWARWNLITAARVLGPKYPLAGRTCSAPCTHFTAMFFEPYCSVGYDCSTAMTLFDVVADATPAVGTSIAPAITATSRARKVREALRSGWGARCRAAGLGGPRMCR